MKAIRAQQENARLHPGKKAELDVFWLLCFK